MSSGVLLNLDRCWRLERVLKALGAQPSTNSEPEATDGKSNANGGGTWGGIAAGGCSGGAGGLLWSQASKSFDDMR